MKENFYTHMKKKQDIDRRLLQKTDPNRANILHQLAVYFDTMFDYEIWQDSGLLRDFWSDVFYELDTIPDNSTLRKYQSPTEYGLSYSFPVTHLHFDTIHFRSDSLNAYYGFSCRSEGLDDIEMLDIHNFVTSINALTKKHSYEKRIPRG